MDKNSSVYRQVKLLVRVLPFVTKQKCFALKGGTAINLFLRDLPRLSVDSDLHYQRTTSSCYPTAKSSNKAATRSSSSGP